MTASTPTAPPAPAYAYHDANGRPLSGPCRRRKGCPNLSRPGIDACAVHLTPTERATFPASAWHR